MTRVKEILISNKVLDVLEVNCTWVSFDVISDLNDENFEYCNKIKNKLKNCKYYTNFSF
jgi:hypothetical protein